MTTRTAECPTDELPSDAGVSLVELIVAMGLFGLLASVLLGFALSTGDVTDDTRQIANVSEESQLAMERMTRELRQAKEISAVQLPATASSPTSFTFWTDFNGDGIKDFNAVDPEVLTYQWTPASGNLTLSANDTSGNPVTRPVLASKVSSLDVEFRSSAWEYDADGNGTTTWQELDAAATPTGNHNGVPDDSELDLIDLLNITMTVTDGSHRLTYRTQVDLRNQIQD